MKRIVFALLLVLGSYFLSAQTSERYVRILCYNVENLLDTIDNPSTLDDEFAPTSPMAWNTDRYYDKLKRIAQVISEAGETEWPELVGLVEIENAEVLEDLLHYTGLGDKGYRYLVSNGNDPRGIDVALLYRAPYVKVLDWGEHAVAFADTTRRSRPILAAHLELEGGVDMHALVVHFPSRRGGAAESEIYRREAARSLRQLSDSLYAHSPRIIVMGDFNGDPDEVATTTDLGAKLDAYTGEGDVPSGLTFYNLTSRYYLAQSQSGFYGSYCYRGEWTQLDHLIVSSSLLQADSPLRYVDGSAEVYAPKWLGRNVHRETQRLMPWRTYAGNHYLGGYSDHYPVRLRLRLK